MAASIRSAKSTDAAAMLGIYAPSILETPASFETELPSLAEFTARFHEYQSKFPWLVWEEGGEVRGYAYASTHRTRAAYAWSVECTAYVQAGQGRRGIGRSLYTELFKRLKAQGVVTVLAGITLPNAASVGLHESLGFRHLGTYADIGFKFGKWWDVGWWQLQLQRPELPGPLTSPDNR